MVLHYEDFNDKLEYIDYLERNGLITHGCAMCMNAFDVCEEAVAKFASPDELYVECIPFCDIEPAHFPTSCLGKWHGDEYIKNFKEENFYEKQY